MRIVLFLVHSPISQFLDVQFAKLVMLSISVSLGAIDLQIVKSVIIIGVTVSDSCRVQGAQVAQIEVMEHSRKLYVIEGSCTCRSRINRTS